MKVGPVYSRTLSGFQLGSMLTAPRPTVQETIQTVLLLTLLLLATTFPHHNLLNTPFSPSPFRTPFFIFPHQLFLGCADYWTVSLFNSFSFYLPLICQCITVTFGLFLGTVTCHQIKTQILSKHGGISSFLCKNLDFISPAALSWTPWSDLIWHMNSLPCVIGHNGKSTYIHIFKRRNKRKHQEYFRKWRFPLSDSPEFLCTQNNCVEGYQRENEV